MRPFETYLRLLIRDDKDDGEAGDIIRDKMDKPWYDMTDVEQKLIEKVSEALCK